MNDLRDVAAALESAAKSLRQAGDILDQTKERLDWLENEHWKNRELKHKMLDLFQEYNG